MQPISGRITIALFLLTFATFAVAACAEEPTPTPTVAPTVAATATPVATARATATALPPTGTPRPSPTAVPPSVSLDPQTIGVDGAVTVAAVRLDAPGWLVLQNGDGTVVGATPLPAGDQVDVLVTVDPLALGPSLTAALYYDVAHPGALDLPEGDPPVLIDGTPVRATATITLDVPLPAIIAADQPVGADGALGVDRVIAPAPGWVAVFADIAGVPGALLAYQAVPQGRSDDLTLTLNMFQATPRVTLVLYRDAGEIGRFEPAVDPPVVAQGEPIQLALDLALPPDIFILDQPVFDGVVHVEHVIAPDAGWLAIYQDDEGFPSRVIGFTSVSAGWNERLQVDVVASLVSPELHAYFHTDTEPLGEFGFPGGDPVLLIDNQVPPPFTFNTAPGNYLISQDQALDESAVLVTHVVVDAPTWVVVYADTAGEPGAALDQVWVPAGLTRDVRLSVSGVAAGATLYLVLHLDAGTAEQFDYPDGPDIPLQRGGQIIQLPILILPGT